ncbi:MAG: DsbA family protein [Polyangiales bacterium]
MTTKSRLIGAGIHSYLGARDLRRALARVGRFLHGGRRRVDFYYRADDPYSHLLAQVLPELAASFELDVHVIPVDRPTLGANPAPEMLAYHAMRDARLLAERHGLRFPLRDATPPEDRVRRAHAVLLEERPLAEQLELVARIGDTVWHDDGEALATIVNERGAATGESVGPLLARNYTRLERAGHYQPGMLHYGGEWYWGVDRLHYLVARLREEGLSGDFSLPTGPAPSLRTMLDGATKPTVRLFLSFRSPYSYLSLPQFRALRDEGLINLEILPVLPMVMRGLPVPLAKRLYIASDAKREADRLGIPFGRICDPLGKGIEYCFSLFHRIAAPRGIELEFCLSVLQGGWSEARDIASVRDLIFLAERVGISKTEVREAIVDDSWKTRAEANRKTLTDLGLWGVPSVQVGSYATWGQDRVPLIRATLSAS